MGATSCWMPNTTWRGPNATWHALFAPFLGGSVPLGWSHVVLEAQRDMARSFYLLLGRFGSFGLVPRRVGGTTRHGALPIRRGALVLLPFEGIWTFGARAMSRWRPIATWRTPNTTWRTRFAPFWAVLPPLGRSHVVLEGQRDMAGSQYDVAHSFYPLFGGFGPLELDPRRVGGPTRHGGGPMRRDALFHLLSGCFGAFVWALQQKSHLRTISEVAGLMLIWFLVCLTCQLGH